MSIFRARVDAAQFCKALNHVLRFAAKRPVLPILGEAKVSFEEGRCTLTCTNLKQWCMAMVPAVGDSFSFVFSGTQSIMSACKYFAGELEFTYTCIPTDTEPEPAGTLVLSAGGRSMERSTQRISDFPEFTEKPMDRHYPVDAEKLLERFKRIGYAVSPDDKRPARCCIEFVGDKILAVDGYRMAMSSDPSICVEKPFFIPPEVMAELQMFKGQDCTISVAEIESLTSAAHTRSAVRVSPISAAHSTSIAATLRAEIVPASMTPLPVMLRAWRVPSTCRTPSLTIFWQARVS